MPWFVNKWDYEWVDPTHRGMVNAGILNIFKPGGDKEMLSHMWEVMFGKTWPNWKVTIYKDYGCPIMVWGYWKIEFCWLWMNETRNHGVHFGANICPFGYFVTHLSWIYFVFVGLNIHLYYRYENIRFIENIFFHYVFLILFSFFILILFNSSFFIALDNLTRGSYIEAFFTGLFSVLIIVVLGAWAYLTQF